MTRGPGAPSAAPVEDYLDRLLLTLSGSPRQIRRMLAEVEAHLQDLVDEGIAAGLPPSQAEASAVRRIGPPHVVCGRAAPSTRPASAFVRSTVLAASLIGGVGLVAIGFSGILSWILAGIHGGSFVTAPFPAGSYTHADCARWLSGDPSAHNCVTAMIADHVGDIALQGCGAGLAGIVVLLACCWLRRRWQDLSTRTALPPGSAELAGGILATITALVMLGSGINAEIIQRGMGAGQRFSLACAGAAAAVFFAVRFCRFALGHAA